MENAVGDLKNYGIAQGNCCCSDPACLRWGCQANRPFPTQGYYVNDVFGPDREARAMERLAAANNRLAAAIEKLAEAGIALPPLSGEALSQ